MAYKDPDYHRKWYIKNRERLQEKNRANSENHSAYCKERYATKREEIIAKAKAYYEKNREKINDRRRKKSQDPEEKKKLSINNKKWREKNREYDLSQQRKHYANNRQERLKKQKEYAKLHPDIIADNTSRRRARKQNAPGIRPINRLRIFKRDNYICHICGKYVPVKQRSIDHLIPLARGGTHTEENVALAHLICNLKRGTGERIAAQLRLFG